MSDMPYVPMRPDDLPDQKLVEIVGMEPVPEPQECIVGFGNVPQKYQTKEHPRSPLYLGQTAWSWGWRSDRIDAYYLHRGRYGWVLWARFPFDSDWYWEWEVAGFMSKAGISERQAAQHLLRAFWEYEKEENDLDHYHWINAAEFLSVRELKSIAVTVWGSGLS